MHLLAATALIAWPALASAQGTPPAGTTEPQPQAKAQPPAEGSVSDGDIIVTAQKRSEALNDVPEAITAFSAETRQIVGIQTLQDFAKLTPGLSYDSSGDRVFLRGVGRVTNTAGSDPGVATYLDGIYDSSTTGVGASDFFIQRVEILRGPQGTLYGRNSIGGAINAISKRPTKELAAEGRVTVGNYDAQTYEASVSGPITEGLRMRLAGSLARQGDGYFTNVAGGPSEGGVNRTYYVEGQIEADVTPDATLWLKGFTNGSRGRPRSVNLVTAYDYGPYPTGSVTPGAAFGYLLPGYVALGSAASNPAIDDKREFSEDTTSSFHLRDSYGVQGQLDVKLQPFDMRVLGGWRQYKYDSLSDLDDTSVRSYTFPLSTGSICGFVPGCTALTEQPAQAFKYLEDRSYGSAEVDFLSNGNGPLNWITGLYYYGERLKQRSDFNSIDQAQIKAPVNGPANPSSDYVYAATNLRTDSYAAFGQVDWDVTSTVRLTGGLRYTRDEKRALETFRIVCLGCAAGLTPDQLGTLTPALDITANVASFAPGPGIAYTTVIDPNGQARRLLIDDWSAITGTAGIQWQPSGATLAYANFSRGYKSGGFGAGGIVAVPEADPEYIDAYQAGLKQKLGGLQLNVAGYFYNYRGLQIPLTIPQPGGGIDLGQFFNLDHAKSYGVEVEGTFNVFRGFQLSGNYAYADSEIRSCCYYDSADPTATQVGAQPANSVGGRVFQSLNGQELPQIPRHRFAVIGTYSLDVGPGTVTLAGTYSWRDRQYTSVFNRSYYQVPSFGQADARLTWTGAGGGYRVIGFVKNIFDTLGYDGVSGSPGSGNATPYALAIDPRFDVAYSRGILPPRTYGMQLQIRF